MNDQMNYMNAYVDTLMGIVHEQILAVSHSKTQNKINTDLVNALTNENNRLEALVNDLQNQLSLKSNIETSYNVDLANAGNELASLRSEISTLKSKAGHVDGLTAQISSMKAQILERDKKIEELEGKLKAPKKSKTKAKPILIVEQEPEVF